jgi:antitoxin Phd
MKRREVGMRVWKLEDAKNGFSEVVRRAIAHEPQLVTRNGKEAVVVVSAEDYKRLVAPADLVEFLRDSPLAGALAEDGLDLSRQADFGRDVSI